MCKVASNRILFINCYDAKRFNIPMGTFGLCDYLSQNGIEARIINLSLYNKSQITDRLNECVCDFVPDMIGLIMHWKELFMQAVDISKHMKNIHEEIPILAGGITASYLGGDLLKKVRQIDFIIRGDAEYPILQLMKGNDYDAVPNLIYRRGKRVIISREKYSISKQTLNNISFSKLRYLIDYGRYIGKLRCTRGFSVFIGRGCVYGCVYCGGSRQCFVKHSHRRKPVVRSINAIIKDLRILANYTDHILICYEIQPSYIVRLFKAIASDGQLSQKFMLDYESFRLVGKKWIDSYIHAFKTSSDRGGRAPIIAFSPETSIETSRKIVRDVKLFFTNRQMLNCIDYIMSKFCDKIGIVLYFGRYHETHKSWHELIREIEGIENIQRKLDIKKLRNVGIIYQHVATDLGTKYWLKAFEESCFKSETEFLMSSMKQSSLMGNKASSYFTDFCIYHPAQLLNEEILIHEMTISMMRAAVTAKPFSKKNIFSLQRYLKFESYIKNQ